MRCASRVCGSSHLSVMYERVCPSKGTLSPRSMRESHLHKLDACAISVVQLTAITYPTNTYIMRNEKNYDSKHFHSFFLTHFSTDSLLIKSMLPRNLR